MDINMDKIFDKSRLNITTKKVLEKLGYNNEEDM